MDNEIVVTAAMRRAVLRDECVRSGHSFEVIEMRGNPDPVDLICDRCGKRWPVVPSDTT